MGAQFGSDTKGGGAVIRAGMVILANLKLDGAVVVAALAAGTYPPGA